MLDRASDEPLRWEVKCGDPSSMVSDVWGMKSFSIDDRGHFCEEPGSDAVDDRLFALLGAWEPTDHRAAYEAAFVEAYVTGWQEAGLPPFEGQVAEGPTELMISALERIIGTDGEAWVA